MSKKFLDVEEMVRTIGYQLTTFIGSTDVRTIARWLHEGAPEALQTRLRAALNIAEPIERVESGFPRYQQRNWDLGENWPYWNGFTHKIPEMAAARTVPDLQTGFPFKYLRRS